jgi:LPXTG-site transpeptidase (sortase) family protein
MYRVTRPAQSINYRRYTIVVVGVFFIAFGSWQYWQRFHATKSHADVTNLNWTIVNSTESPAETKVDIGAHITVPANQAKVLRLPSIASEGLIQKVGVDQHNQVAVPANVHMVGWYVNSVTPGEKGLSIIDGHVSGKYSAGVFKMIHQLKQGDHFSIEFGNGRVKKFIVQRKQDVATKDADKVLFVRDHEYAAELKLITCSGKFNKQSSEYNNRLIVTAKAV